MKTIQALVGDGTIKSDRCCGELGTLAVAPRHLHPGALPQAGRAAQGHGAARRRASKVAAAGNVKVLTSTLVPARPVALPETFRHASARTSHRGRVFTGTCWARAGWKTTSSARNRGRIGDCWCNPRRVPAKRPPNPGGAYYRIGGGYTVRTSDPLRFTALRMRFGGGTPAHWAGMYVDATAMSGFNWHAVPSVAITALGRHHAQHLLCGLSITSVIMASGRLRGVNRAVEAG